MTKKELIEEVNKMIDDEEQKQQHSLTANDIIYHRAAKETLMEVASLIERLEAQL